jgi:hypothetical protein
MKPLPAATLTDEDINIGVWLMARWIVRFGEARLNCELAQDARDAHLMWLREWSKSDSERYHDECWSLNRRAWWPVHWGLA